VNDLQLLSIFMVGLLGGVHCVGMCGGIVSAFSLAPNRRSFPIAVVSQSAALTDTGRVLAFNAGRLTSYAFAGAVAGGVAQSVQTLAFTSVVQTAGYWLANLMLVALGLYLMDAWRGLTRVEAAGQVLWRRIQPATKHLIPVDNVIKAYALGGLWGWVPCGMVYSVLLTAMLSGSATNGALVMLAFGAGTLPVMLTMGLLGASVRAWTRQRHVRLISGLLVLAFGLLGMMKALNGVVPAWLDSLCITPSVSHSIVGTR
jgi:sulfite exporter TauE/SafE